MRSKLFNFGIVTTFVFCSLFIGITLQSAIYLLNSQYEFILYDRTIAGLYILVLTLLVFSGWFLFRNLIVEFVFEGMQVQAFTQFIYFNSGVNLPIEVTRMSKLITIYSGLPADIAEQIILSVDAFIFWMGAALIGAIIYETAKYLNERIKSHKVTTIAEPHDPKTETEEF